jgi:hypothetical protein
MALLGPEPNKGLEWTTHLAGFFRSIPMSSGVGRRSILAFGSTKGLGRLVLLKFTAS